VQERTLHYGQRRLIEDSSHTEHLICAGIRYGKSMCGPAWHYARVKWNKGSKTSLVVAPTFKLAEEICVNYYRDFLLSIGLREGFHFEINYSKLRIYFPSLDHTILTLSGTNPETIVGFTSSHAWNDEAALNDPEVRRRILQRNSFTCKFQQTLHTTTPIGTNWLYDEFGPDKCERKEGTPYSESDTKLVLHGRTMDNPYLGSKYLRTIEEEFGYDSQYYANYILGEWTSLSKDRFYFNFDDRAHVGSYPIDPELRTLYLSFDNNVGQMTWVVIQNVVNGYRIVSDNGGKGRNIEDACNQFVSAFPPVKWRGHLIVVLGDAALWARSVHSHDTGYDLIQHFLKPHYPGLRIGAPRGNPFVNERSITTNRLFGQGRIQINSAAKKVIQSAKTAEQDKNGKIKKPSGDTWTHAMEAVDMALMVLEPTQIVRGYQGIKSL
jgi:hypothetical protein